eukprot:SAG31_NODE_3934_length_3737_cov_14.336998_2_plen_62_part_00
MSKELNLGPHPNKSVETVPRYPVPEVPVGTCTIIDLSKLKSKFDVSKFYTHKLTLNLVPTY